MFQWVPQSLKVTFPYFRQARNLAQCRVFTSVLLRCDAYRIKHSSISPNNTFYVVSKWLMLFETKQVPTFGMLRPLLNVGSWLMFSHIRCLLNLAVLVTTVSSPNFTLLTILLRPTFCSSKVTLRSASQESCSM